MHAFSLRHRKSYSCWTICLYLSEEHHRTLVWRYVYPHIHASRYHCLRVCISLREKQSKKYMVWSWFDYTVIYLQKTLIALSLFTCKCISYTHVYLRIYVHAYQSQTHLDLFWFTVGIPSSDIENVIFAPFWVIVKQETKRNKQKQIETKRDTTETKRSEKRHNRNETKPKKKSAIQKLPVADWKTFEIYWNIYFAMEENIIRISYWKAHHLSCFLCVV